MLKSTNFLLKSPFAVLDHCDVIRKESKEKDGQGTHEAENSGARL